MGERERDGPAATDRPVTRLPLGATGRLFREHNTCDCNGDYQSFLATWRAASEVRMLVGDGPGLDERRFTRLTRAFDRSTPR